MTTQTGSGTGTPLGIFTYDITSIDQSIKDRSRIRMLIGDTQENAGPRPDSRNFNDTEIDTFLALESGSIQRAAAAALETLASEWAGRASKQSLGPTSIEATQASHYRQQAAEFRRAYGHTADSKSAGAPEEAGASNIIHWTNLYEYGDFST